MAGSSSLLVPQAAGPSTAKLLAGSPAATLRPLPACDARLAREIAHRRLVVAFARRVLRVVTLHLLDGALLTGVLFALISMWPAGAAARPLVPAVVGLFLLSLNAMSAYRPGNGRRDRGRLLLGVLLALLVLSCFTALPPRLPFDAYFLALLGGAAFAALALGRYATDQAMRAVYRQGIGLRRAIVVGAAEEVELVRRGVSRRSIPEQRIVGYLTTTSGADPQALGRLEDLEAIIERHDVQEVLIAAALSGDDLRSIAQCCFDRGTDLYLAPPAAARGGYRTEPLQLGGYPVFRLHPSRLKVPGLMVKRVVDVVLATLALVLLSPLIALIAIAIKLDSPGPVFFLQQRVGLGGRRFTMWKFRSMQVGAEQREAELAHLNIYGENGTFKLANDPRVTRMGRVLRRTSLDELPQLINILKGEMSIVGPRPALVSDLARYAPHHYERLSVVPGLTGPWQVGGRNLITDFETILGLERNYIRNWSLWTDVKIVLRTFMVVITGEGAY